MLLFYTRFPSRAVFSSTDSTGPMTFSPFASFSRSLFLLTSGALLMAMGLLTGCDMQEAQTAAEEFEVVVELPSIETVASVQAIDLTSKTPVNRPITLTFAGPDAGSVIDAYSDPVSTLQLTGGFTSFGIENARAPSAEDPVELMVRAEADGYQPAVVSVRLNETGTTPVRIPMVREDPRQSPPGVSGTRAHARLSEGMLQETIRVSTPDDGASPAPKASSPHVTIDAGTQLTTAAGEPLQGDLTVDVATYETTDEGLMALPATLRNNAPGRSMAGAMRLRVSDAQGRVASSFTQAPDDASVVTHAQTTASAPGMRHSSSGGIEFTLNTGTVSNEMALSHYVLRIQNGDDVVEVYVPLSVVQGESLTFGIQGNQLVVGDETHTISDLVGDSGNLYIGLQGVASQTCTPRGTIEIDPNGQTGSATVMVSDNGLYYETSVSLPTSGTASVAVSSLVTDSSLPDIDTDWAVQAVAPNGEVTSAEADLCTHTTTTLTLPRPPANTIDATVEVHPNCPAGESIPFTGNLDGYVLNYRKAGSSADFQPVPGRNVTMYSTDTAFEKGEVLMENVEPNTTYEFYGAFDGDSGYRDITMPGTNGGTVPFTDQEISNHCQ